MQKKKKKRRRFLSIERFQTNKNNIWKSLTDYVQEKPWNCKPISEHGVGLFPSTATGSNDNEMIGAHAHKNMLNPLLVVFPGYGGPNCTRTESEDPIFTGLFALNGSSSPQFDPVGASTEDGDKSVGFLKLSDQSKQSKVESSTTNSLYAFRKGWEASIRKIKAQSGALQMCVYKKCGYFEEEKNNFWQMKHLNVSSVIKTMTCSYAL